MFYFIALAKQQQMLGSFFVHPQPHLLARNVGPQLGKHLFVRCLFVYRAVLRLKKMLNTVDDLHKNIYG